MRSKWNTTLDVGLISLPVQTFTARETGGTQLHQYHEGCGGEVGRRAWCKQCDQAVEWGSIVKGVQNGDDVVLLTDAELDDCRGEVTGYEIVAMVPAEQISPLWLDGADYLVPDVKRGKTAVKSYAVIRDAMASTGRVGVVRYTFRGVSHIAVLGVHRDAATLTLQPLVWAEQLRRPDFDVLTKPVDVSAKEAQLARQLLDSMSEDFDYESYRDEYAHAVADLVEAKAAGTVRVSTGDDTAEAEPAVADLLARLEASIAAKDAETAAKSRHPSTRRRKSA
ncbi:Ku protein [Mycobacterium sp. 94-17]|uniref:non-homologous end joining protein Ku n=1 Tax=Mycobacterium sp. 94-17 TaxID=2986147 RepID=UPI002D1F2BD4|nr:Ku protein [Mycobacterium sp. 94-17]MEB4210963.1 hypothetical protein [Mycobacterium sp. 94-17]